MVPIHNFLPFLANLIHTLMTYIQNENVYKNEIPSAPLLTFFNIISIAMQILLLKIKYTEKSKFRTWSYKFGNILCLYSVPLRQVDLFTKLSQNRNHFYWLTGEIPPSFDDLVQHLQQYRQNNGMGRKQVVSFQNQVLLTLIWICRYATMHHLSVHFGISVSCVHRIIHRILPILHVYLVPTYIKWHSAKHWNDLAREIPHWPRVVAIVDGTPFRISKPSGHIQRLFWRKDRHCFFLNWIVIVDVRGFIVFSRPGFLGHLHDSTCFRHLQIPALPAGLQIMADQGFANKSPLLLPISPNQVPPRGIMKSHFKSARSSIERVFGTLKFTYAAVGTRCFRSRRHIAPILLNVGASLNNRRRIILSIWRNNLIH